MGTRLLCFLAAVLTLGQVFADQTLLDVGPKECAKGTEFWCQSLDTARSCGAVKHCIQNVWPRRTLAPDNSSICDLCKEMVKEARDQLQSNETQEEIKEVFEGTCRIYFPIKAIADECIRMVDDYIPDLIEELSSMMNPQAVCATAWLCNSNKFLEMIGIQEFKKVGTVCDECTDTATNFIQKVKSESSDQFQTELENVCTHLPSVETPCKMGVKMFGKSLYNTVINMQPRELCLLSGLCDGLPSKPIYQLTLTDGRQLRTNQKLGADGTVRDDPECDMCKQLVLHLRDLIMTNSTEEEVKDTLLQLCRSFGSLSDSCTTYVNEYFDEIYNFLANELDPELVCSVIGVCSSRMQQVPMVSLVPAKRLTGQDEANINKLRLIGQDEAVINGLESNSIDWTPGNIQLPQTRLIPQSLISGQAADAQRKLSAADAQLPDTLYMPQALVPGLATTAQRRTSGISSGVTCALCEYALHELQIMLGDNKTEQAITHALQQLCSRLPATLTQECQEYVKDYGDMIIALLQQEIDPSVMCTQMGLCTSSTLQTTQAPMPSLNVKTPMSRPHLKKGAGMMKSKVKGLTTCELCNLVISYVDSMLEDRPTEDAIVHALENVCGLVPKNVYTECQSLIETYGDAALSYIATIADSKKVCQAMSVCPRPKGQVDLLGGNRCTYGPSYWCQSLFHARACKAEQHCRDKVWK